MEEGAETSTLDPVPGDFIWHFHNLEDAFSVLELDISNLAYDQAVLDLAVKFKALGPQDFQSTIIMSLELVV